MLFLLKTEKEMNKYFHN